jgi:glycosyltransferase involved in cell wall biosynthesis
MGHRARALTTRLSTVWQPHIYYRTAGKLRAIIEFSQQLRQLRPALCYVFDMGYSGVLAGAAFCKLRRIPLVIETGDAITALAPALDRGLVGVQMTRVLEALSFWAADHCVVRGHFHQTWLAQRGIQASVIPDGVETDQFRPSPASELRDQLDLGDLLTVGLVGSSRWSKRLQTCYGWELVELIRELRTEPVCGVMIGDGTGIPVLQARCKAYGIEDRVLFLGRLPYEELPRYLNLLDVCLWTQTNNLVGQVRTTGKLPLYLATGRYVLATRVGEAARLLDEEMLVDVKEGLDACYPLLLAERVRALVRDRTRLQRGLTLIDRARQHYDYGKLALQLESLLLSLVPHHGPAQLH